jgi:hypothetical protein
MTLARDFVKAPLEKGVMKSTDVISVVVMRDVAEVVIECEPVDWVLYNKFLDMREWTTLRPSGAGNYMPAINMAEKLLTVNLCGGCALSLLFFSDGKPSDRGNFASSIGDVASKFGRRLSFTCIGMASNDEDFSTLHDMVKEADQYGCISSFGRPRLDTESLSHIITTLATSLTTTKTEMTDLKTGKVKVVRTDVLREKKGTEDDSHLTEDWWKYDFEYVVGFYSWSYKNDDFAEIMDRRCHYCWKKTQIDVARDETRGRDGVFVCIGCSAVCFCSEACWKMDHFKHARVSKDCGIMLEKRHNGAVVSKSMTEIPSFGVAVKNKMFESGAERQVRKFRFLGADQHTFTGPIMVAKESRFVEEESTYQHRHTFHREFLRTQAIAARLSSQFNEAVASLGKEVSTRTPSVEFLVPLVVEVNDKKLKNYCFLIEPMLSGKYEKFNNNKGHVKGQHKDDAKRTVGILDKKFIASLGDIHTGMETLSLSKAKHGPGPLDKALGAIEEGSEDEDTDSDEEDLFECQRNTHAHTSRSRSAEEARRCSFNDDDTPQAFSHFTFQHCRRRLMVVDLQGVLETTCSGAKTFRLTDPVIHRRKKSFRKWDFGRTNLGEKGMQAFFETHRCSDLCRALGLKEVHNIDAR